ncbi:MAG: signal recognition particle-docking protein FtsY [Chloroflexi bacterium]|nr:signal recognition particle-docking protein FtsY [Chloroflexota bacterium]
MRFFRRAPKVNEDAPDAAHDAAPDAAPEAADETTDAGDAEQIAASEVKLAAEDEERTNVALERTKRSWFSNISSIFSRGNVDDELWEELEELLIGADAGVVTTEKILNDVRARVADEGIKDASEVEDALKRALVDLLQSPEGKGSLWTDTGSGSHAAPPKPAVILVLGVNGTGKTTTIAKLAHAYKKEGRTTVIAAADTFRAAAIEQLKAWGDRVGADVIAHKQGADPAAVVFDALAAAESRDADAVIIDTAGRLHTQFNLMEELTKLKRIIARKQPDAPHEVLLVLDATIGQNALIQAEAFTKAAEVTSVCLTKLDGTSKGGIVFAIADQMGIPVRLVGTGEEPDDLAPFSAEAFVEALFR